MAEDKKIDGLDQSNAFSGTEQFPLLQNSVTRRGTLNQVLTYIIAHITTADVQENTNLYYTDGRADARVNLHGSLTNNPHSVTKDQVGLANVLNTLHNFTATTDPGTGDDSDDSYSIGSLWVNTSLDKVWACVDSTVGSAVWKDITNASVTAASIGLGNVENTALSTWAGTSNITTVGEAAVTAHNTAIDHNLLANYDGNRHVDHTSVSITAGTGLTGGGTISTSRSLSLDINSLTEETTIAGEDDYIPIYDASAGVIRKATPSNLLAGSADPKPRIRQTVQNGPKDADGRADFLAAGYGNAVDIDCTTEPLQILFAAGFTENGALDYIERVSSDASLADLSLDETAYIYREREIGWGSTIYQPLYSYSEEIALVDFGTTSNAISGGDNASFPKSNAFDGGTAASTSDAWASSQSGVSVSGNAYIGANFGTDRMIVKVRFYTWKATTNTINSVKLEYSSDGSSWTTIQTSDVSTAANNWVELDVAAYPPAAYFRILANGNTSVGSTWAVPEVELLGYNTDQHVYLIPEGKMYYWAGDSWSEVERVFVGESDVISTTKSILDFNGANGSTTITDSGDGLTWTVAGNAQISTTNPKFGTGCLVCDGSGDYVTNANTLLGSGKFTYMGWFRADDLANVRALFGSSVTYSMEVTCLPTGQIRMGLSSNGSSWNIADNLTSTTTVSATTYFHVAVSYDGSTYRLFLNGTKEIEVSSTLTINSANLWVGRAAAVSGEWKGRVDNFVVLKGVCLYSANFTAPATEVVLSDLPEGYVNSTISYAYNGQYNSGIFDVATNTNYALSHNIGCDILEVTKQERETSAHPWCNDTHTLGSGCYGGIVTFDNNEVTLSYSTRATWDYVGDQQVHGAAFTTANATTGQARILMKRNF